MGRTSADSTAERNLRFLEEAVELVQACSCSKEEALKVVDYVFSRSRGTPAIEIGDVMISLAALANRHEVNMEEAGELRLIGCWQNVEHIRAKQAEKPH